MTLSLFLLSPHERVHTHVAMHLLAKFTLPRSEHPRIPAARRRSAGQRNDGRCKMSNKWIHCPRVFYVRVKEPRLSHIYELGSTYVNAYTHTRAHTHKCTTYYQYAVIVMENSALPPC